MTIKEITGDLFESRMSILVCPVNIVGAMGAGIAFEFRRRYPDLYYQYKRQCRSRKFKQNSLMVFSPHASKHRILLAPTKISWNNPSPPEVVEATIVNIRKLADMGKLSSIAMPLLGCGKGGLNPTQVKEWIYRELDSIPLEVELYVNRG